MQNKPNLSFWQIFNMSFGFLGIQFGWGLQLANMSAIYTKLGANPDSIPILWLAGPITGLLVQPIIGSLSDRTWTWLGRRRPYFMVGAILASVGLFLMPDSPALWAAATLLWILDASINVSMEPFRAFVADKLNDEQRTKGFIMQAFFIGIGATLANSLPFIFSKLGVTGNAANGIPLSVYYSFKIGAGAFLLCVLYTVLTSKEYPPEDMEEFNRQKSQRQGIGEFFAEILDAFKEMPATMKQLAVVQFFTWLGLFCMWMFYGLTTSYHVFNAPNKDSKLFDQGSEWSSLMFGVYSLVCFLVAFLLPFLAKNLGRKTTHALALVCGGLGLLGMYFVNSPNGQYLTMIGVGIAWASILAMPYAILSGALPAKRMGVYMGIFNFFIVIPEIVASFTFGSIIRGVTGEFTDVKPFVIGDTFWQTCVNIFAFVSTRFNSVIETIGSYIFAPIYRSFFGQDTINTSLFVVMAGGVFMIVAAICVLFVKDVGEAVIPIRADETEGFTVQQNAQPVPSSGLLE